MGSWRTVCSHAGAARTAACQLHVRARCLCVRVAGDGRGVHMGRVAEGDTGLRVMGGRVQAQVSMRLGMHVKSGGMARSTLHTEA